jgi:hypothetical protein
VFESEKFRPEKFESEKFGSEKFESGKSEPENYICMVLNLCCGRAFSVHR